MTPHPLPDLIYQITQDVRARHPDRPALIGVGGAQGSGKSTVCTLLEMANRPRFAHFSLDDVYWPPNQREQLAKRKHPLFITRGPPGTHDTDRARFVIQQLMNATPETETGLPRYDKLADADVPREQWPMFKGQPEAILVDGWCMGAYPPNTTDKPINAIERIDSDGIWRLTQAEFLSYDYSRLFGWFDAIIYLQAPSWEIVRTWRGEQEERALGRPLTAEESVKLDRFVMHYERITRSMMAGEHSAKWIAHLDEARNVVRVEQRP